MNILPPCKLIELDLSGVEAVILGWYAARLTNDPSVIRWAKLGLHALVASHLLRTPPDPSWPDPDIAAYFQTLKKSHPDEYDTCKRTVHGTGYGMTPEGMVLMFPQTYTDLKHAQKIQKVYFDACPPVPAFQLFVKKHAAQFNRLGGVVKPGLDILSDHVAHVYGYEHEFFNVVEYRKLSPGQARAMKQGRSTISVPVIDINGLPYAMKWGPDSKRCVTPDTKVWMGDYTYKPIGEVKVGDMVIGWRRGTEPKLPSRGNHGTQYMTKEKAYTADHLAKALVTEVHSHIDSTLTITLASGRTVRCTDDHQWLGMRRSNRKGGPRYVWWRADKLKVGDELAVTAVTDPGDCPQELRETAAWLGGFYDGEGSHRGVSQKIGGPGNLDARAEAAFHALGFETTRQEQHKNRKGWQDTVLILWTGGQQAALKFARWVPAYRFREQWADRMLLLGRFRRLDKVVRIERNPLSEPVVCITTTTGNFIANDICSHNCLAFYPQSTNSGGLNEIQIELFDEPDSPTYIGNYFYGRTPLRAPIHDSLFMECPFRKVDSLLEKAFTAMLRPYEEMPLRPEWNLGAHLTVGVEGKIGDDWEHMEKIPTPSLESLGVANDGVYFPADESEDESVIELRTAVA